MSDTGSGVCSFCGEHADATRTFVGNGVAICEGCVKLAAAVLEDRTASPPEVGTEDVRTHSTCGFCGRTDTRVAPAGSLGMCAPCIDALPRLIFEGSQETLKAIWCMETDEGARERVLAESSRTAASAKAHCDLAVAYAEMGLRFDALLQAGMAIACDPGNPKLVKAALGVALGGEPVPAVDALKRELPRFVKRASRMPPAP